MPSARHPWSASLSPASTTPAAASRGAATPLAASPRWAICRRSTPPASGCLRGQAAEMKTRSSGWRWNAPACLPWRDAGIPPSSPSPAARWACSSAPPPPTSLGSDRGLEDPASGDRHFLTGSAPSVIASRLTNVSDLRGAAEVVDTACSSSLVALAPRGGGALRRGRRWRCACAGGVHALLAPWPFLGFARGGDALALRPLPRSPTPPPTAMCKSERGARVPAQAARRPRWRRAIRCGRCCLAPASTRRGARFGLSLPSREAQAALLERVAGRLRRHPRRLRLFRGAWHRHPAPAIRPRPGRSAEAIGRRRAALAAGRLHQVEHRPSGTAAGWHRRAAEGRC